ncbi:MAG: hypothetical protein HFE78_08670, partial [Clostridiales bacterium]|nr:hypothetical protein [Clostridiales bacterium]
MKLKKLIAAFLSVVMVLSLVPAMLLSVSADDETVTEQPEKLPIKDIISSRLLNSVKESAFDGDASTYARCIGYDGGEAEAKNQYIGCSFPVEVKLTSVYVDSSYPELITWEHWGPEVSIEVSEDGETWVTAYIFNENKSDKTLNKIDQTISVESFKAEAKAVKVHYARLRQTITDSSIDSSNPNGSHDRFWNGLTIRELAFYGEMDTVVTTCDLVSEGAAGADETVSVKVKLTDTSVQIKEAALTIEYDTDLLAYGEDTTGSVELNIAAADVKEDGTVGELVFTRKNVNQNNSVVFCVLGTGKTADDKDIALLRNTKNVQLGSQQTGLFLSDSEIISLNKNEGDKAPAKQDLLNNQVFLKNNGIAADGFTLVYKIDGIAENNPVVANAFSFIANGGGTWDKSDYVYLDRGWMPTIAEGQKGSMEVFSFTKNGYLFLYQNRRIFDNQAYNVLSNVYIFDNQSPHNQQKNDDGTYKNNSYAMPKGSNTNENATFQLMAVVADNLKPTVTFYGKEKAELGETDQPIATYTHAYSDVTGSTTDPAMVRINGELISAKAMFEAMNAAKEEEAEGTSIPVPTKTSDNPKVTYEFENWVDEEGNVVDVVYASGNVYPKFKMIDTRERYTIKFVNDDDTVLEEKTVIEGEKIEYTGETPEKASTDTNSYEFKGWDPELAADAVATENATYKAQYTETERKYDVTFMDEDKASRLDKVRVSKGEKAETSVVPTKAAD